MRLVPAVHVVVVVAAAVCVVALAGTSAGCAPDVQFREPRQLTPLPPLAETPRTARERTLVPAHAEAHGGLNPALPGNVQAYLDDGVDALDDGAGDDVVVENADGTTGGGVPAPGPNARRIARFVHLSDIQLMDDESPGRAADFDSQSVTSAIRPEDPLMCRMLNAAVRTVNGLNAADAVDFLLLGGDNSDSAQKNEIGWVMQILDGADRVECDSGEDDDLDPNEDDDGKDPFAAAGLDVPWKWVSGNHDVTVQGTFAIDDTQRGIATGTVARFGTRAYDEGGFGVIVDGDGILDDPGRALVDGPALLDLVGGDGDGHGLAASTSAASGAVNERGKAFSSFDVGDELTFLVLDTTHARGGAEGVLQQSDVDRFVKPVLDDALARGRAVVLASHHSASSLSTDGGIFGVAEDDALTEEQWLAFLAHYPNVVFSMVGHAHRNRIALKNAVDGDVAHAYFEVMTSALADFPHEMRLVEIFDDDNGFLRMETTPLDYAADDDPPADLGRRLGLVDFLSGWNGSDARGAPADRTATLLVPFHP